MTTKIFQSYIIVGDKKQTQDMVGVILNSLGINISPSPDIAITIPEKSISIGQVREIKMSIFQKPFVLKYRVNIIKEAEKLTAEAQNALLKIFEEPPRHSIIILETASPKNLLETLRSRAIIINTVPKQTTKRQEETKNLKDRLISMAESTDPQTWIDEQINLNYELLKKQIDTNQTFNATTKRIEYYKEAKQMIAANVNSRLVLASAILATSANNHEQ